MSEQSDAMKSFLSGMGRKAREIKEKVIPSPKDSPPLTPSPGMLGTGAAARAGESTRSTRREREAGVD